MRMLTGLLLLIATACGTESFDFRKDSEKNNAKQVTVDAPETIVARVPISDAKRGDMSRAEYLPVEKASLGLTASQYDRAFRMADKNNAKRYNGEFRIQKIDSEDGKFNLCGGGGNCGGGDCGGGGCGGCGGGCGGGGYAFGWVGGLLGGIGAFIGDVVAGAVTIAGEVVVGIGHAITNYKPWYYGQGYNCGYDVQQTWTKGDYRYFEYEQQEIQYDAPVLKGGVIEGEDVAPTYQSPYQGPVHQSQIGKDPRYNAPGIEPGPTGDPRGNPGPGGFGPQVPPTGDPRGVQANAPIGQNQGPGAGDLREPGPIQ